jgi:pyruvate formate lyase activating enzyme
VGTDGAQRLRIGGLTPLTSIDFPGRLAAVLFCQGCPWRCDYCHNPDLLDAKVPGALPWAQVCAFLRRRRGLLDGVVFSGGEPTLQAGLPGALAEVRALGFETALHTAGMYPGRLAALLPLLDWVGLDIKGPWRRIDAITGSHRSAQRVQASLRHLLASGVAYECRTTWHPALFGIDELHTLADELASLGVRRWALQECRSSDGAPHSMVADHAQAFSARFERFTLRRA